MFHILNTSKSGMMAQQQKLDIIANNMVNINTHGYKKIDSSFANLFYKDLNGKGIPTSENISLIGNGVKISQITRNKNQGSLQSTGMNTDVAIDGNGFFKITDGNGQVFYTRNGSLNVDTFGRLTDKDGNLIEVTYDAGIDPLNTGLTNTNLVIDKSGFISTSSGQSIGKINLYDASGNDSLISKGDNKFMPVSQDIIMFQVNSDLYQNHLEMSNVDVSQEMTEMLLAQRAYQMSSKGITTVDEMWSMLNSVR